VIVTIRVQKTARITSNQRTVDSMYSGSWSLR
jgi:hypothetical protein